MKAAVLVMSVIAFICAFGLVGKADYNDGKTYEAHQCEMINTGKWGAAKDLKQFCKNNY